jgi:hypothetical protein
MARRGTVVRAARLSDLLTPIGIIAGTDKLLVTIKSEVYRISGKSKLKYVTKFVQLGSMVREREMEFPRYSIVPNDDGGFDFDELED